MAWTKQNNLTLNPHKTTCTLFTPDPAEYNSNLDIKINNTALPRTTYPKVMGLNLESKLTYSTQIHNISVQTHKPLQMIKVLNQQDGVNRRGHSWLPIRQSSDRLWNMPHPYGHLLHPRPAWTNCKLCRMQHWKLSQDAHRMHTRHKTQTYNICMTN